MEGNQRELEFQFPAIRRSRRPRHRRARAVPLLGVVGVAQIEQPQLAFLPHRPCVVVLQAAVGTAEQFREFGQRTRLDRTESDDCLAHPLGIGWPLCMDSLRKRVQCCATLGMQILMLGVVALVL